MRYYIYLDKEFLRILFSAVEETNFNIEVLEYSLKKSVTTNHEVSIDPCMENINDCEISCSKDHEKNISKRNKEGEFSKERIELSYEKGSACNVQTEIKYINIDDVTDMKNVAFYHKLLEKLRKEVKNPNSRIIEEVGYMKASNEESRKTFSRKINDFFMINQSFVWIDHEKLQGDIDLLSAMECEIKVIGYMMNCKKNKEKTRVLKAIAIYID